MTNEEKLKSLSTKELANKLRRYMECSDCPIRAKCYESGKTCVDAWELYLKSEVEK